MNGLLRLVVITVVLSSVSSASERYTFVPGQGYVVDPKTAPKYLVVSQFFDHAMFYYRAGFSRYEAKQFAIRHNTNAETAIEKAILAARLLSFERMDAMKAYHNQPDDVWDHLQFETLKDEVRGLKKIYTRMLKELAKEGILQETVETFLEKNVRDTVSLASSDPPERELDVMDLFDKEE